MGYPSVRLEATGLTPLLLDYNAGWAIQSLDLGDAETRVVTENWADADGTNDTTAFIGARTVTMVLKLLPSRSGLTKQVMRDRLRAFTNAKLRPIIYIRRDGELEKRMDLRRGQFTAVLDNPGYANVALQMVAPYGVIESVALDSIVANASASGGSEGGRTYNETFDRTYAGGAIVVGTASGSNDGTADAYPVIQVYGPCTDPTITNITQGKALVFAGLTINAGDFLEINTRSKTIRYLGNPADSRYNTLVPGSSAWWTISPGINTIRFTPVTNTFPSNATVVFRDTWL